MSNNMSPHQRHHTEIELREPRQQSELDVPENAVEQISKKRTAAIIVSITFSTGVTSYLSGLVIVALPTIADDLKLGANLLLWSVTSKARQISFKSSTQSNEVSGQYLSTP